MKIDPKIKKYGTLNNIYTELTLKGYSVNEATKFIDKCGVLESHHQSLKPDASMKKLTMCLREARKERKMY